MADVVTVSLVEDGTKLMRWFLRKFPAMPNREFFKLCRGGQIRVNSARVDANRVLRAGDAVRIPPTIAMYAKRENVKKTEAGDAFSMSDLEMLRQSIVYNDDDIVVFNKPAGLAVQGGTGIRKSVDKMAAALFPYEKISLVHRLDRDTSGLLVVAKNQKAAQSLATAFQSKTAHKEYLALLNGTVSPKHGTIDNYIIKGQVLDSPERINGGTGQRPQRAITEYEVLSDAGIVSWVLFSPKTGRTHQLRIHSAYSLGAPIIGDDLYGTDKKIDAGLSAMLATNKLFLFAYRITFHHPRTNKLITIKAPVPDFMKAVMNLLEFQLPE
ncbi:MAG: RluA family pseudouridine synthase [Alphaproteobacteria bacterium]|nr:RluA family pseudouridine synthase [Alphaproteobacteria bacterium]